MSRPIFPGVDTAAGSAPQERQARILSAAESRRSGHSTGERIRGVASPVQRLHRRSVAARGSGATTQESEQNEQRNGNAQEPQQDIADATLLFARLGAGGSIVDAHDFFLMQLAGQAPFLSRRRRVTLWHPLWTGRDTSVVKANHAVQQSATDSTRTAGRRAVQHPRAPPAAGGRPSQRRPAQPQRTTR